MIKQIQLRGISRTPSDRMSEDGGLSESLNMYLDTAENAPVLVPKDVTEELGLPADLQAERIFIHKTANYENYIVVGNDRIVAYTSSDTQPLDILELSDKEKVNDIVSVGNTLVISSTKSMYYSLYKDRDYVFLGDKIPFPRINFTIQYNTSEISNIQETRSWDQGLYVQNHTKPPLDPTGLNGIFDNQHKDVWFFDMMPSEETWNNHTDGKHHISSINNLLDFLSEKLSIVEQELSNTCIYRPFFIRYELELYDSRLSSIPILINPLSAENPFSILTLTTEQEILYNTIPEATTVNYKGANHLLGMYYITKGRIRAKLHEQIDFTNWKDIIKNINIYISKPLPFNVDYKLSTISDRSSYLNEEEGSFNYNGNVYNRKKSMGSSADITLINKTDDEYLSNMLDKSSQVFKVKQIPIYNEKFDLTEDYQNLSTGFVLEVEKFLNPSAENYIPLETQDQMKDDDMKHYLLSSNNLDAYNNRVVLINPTQIIDYDYHKLNATTNARYSQNRTISFDVTYILRGYKKDKVIKKHFECSKQEAVYAFQIFPDSRAYKMIVKAIINEGTDNNVVYGEFDMFPHPYLDCAYYMGGIENHLVDLCLASNVKDYEVYAIDDQENKILLSDSSDPFEFPLNSRYTFQSKVIGIAVATTALSQGQFGQFPLYVFTEDGLWAMEAASDGSFVSQKPLSREVCVNPDSICSIDNAVVFVTAKGVMMIQGSQVMNISPYMNGRHYIPNESAVNLIKNQEGFEQLESAIVDEEPFMTFMKKTKVTYDYAGQRLIFIAEDEAYQYIYKIDTQTWHKVAFDEIDLNTPINSYPECLVQASVSLNKLPIYIYAKSDPNISISTVESLLQDIPNKGPLRQAGIDLSIASNLHDFLSGKTDYVLVSEQGIADDIQNVLGYWGYDIDFYYGSSYEITIEYTDPDYPAEMIRLAEDLSVGFNDFYASLPTPSTTPNLLTAAGWKEFAKTKKVIFKNSDKTNGILETLGPEGLVPKTIDIQRIPVQVTHVYSLSTPLDVSTDQSTAKGILITRPFDLGEPDVYKSIKSIKIRGDFDKENVKYILQGSDNGRDFYTLTSLRGKSWKMFRIFILADLEPTERISWIDVDYEPRYQNKLR